MMFPAITFILVLVLILNVFGMMRLDSYSANWTMAQTVTINQSRPPSPQYSAKTKPNIIFLLIDDLVSNIERQR